MPISLHDATVPSFLQVIGSVLNILDKAEAWGREKGMSDAEISALSLAPDMFPLSFQLAQVAAHSAGALRGVQSGIYSPSLAPPPTDIAALRALLRDAEAELNALDPALLDTLADKDVAFVLRDMRMPFTGANFLLSFAMPNFYFHATTAYDILRHHGVALGKRDFLGNLRLKM